MLRACRAGQHLHLRPDRRGGGAQRGRAASRRATAIEASPRLARAFELIEAGHFSPDDPGRFRPLLDDLANFDHFLVTADFDAYAAAQRAGRADLRRPGRLVAQGRAQHRAHGLVLERPHGARLCARDLARAARHLTRAARPDRAAAAWRVASRPAWPRTRTPPRRSRAGRRPGRPATAGRHANRNAVIRRRLSSKWNSPRSTSSAGSASMPVSSRSSRTAAAKGASPRPMPPPGRSSSGR